MGLFKKKDNSDMIYVSSGYLNEIKRRMYDAEEQNYKYYREIEELRKKEYLDPNPKFEIIVLDRGRKKWN